MTPEELDELRKEVEELRKEAETLRRSATLAKQMGYASLPDRAKSATDAEQKYSDADLELEAAIVKRNLTAALPDAVPKATCPVQRCSLPIGHLGKHNARP